MPPASGDNKPEKSYFSAAVNSINPWSGNRTGTPTPKDLPRASSPLPAANPADHSTNFIYGQSVRRYPQGCPPLVVQWFHAVDIPKRKPEWLAGKQPAKDNSKPAPQPKKYVAFSAGDSRSIENAYQKILEGVEDERSVDTEATAAKRKRRSTLKSGEQGVDVESGSDRGKGSFTGTRVLVNEDFLFDVDIKERELAPVYWLGPTYDVRRGTWFYQEGATLRPCEENLAAQLEEGYLKIKPWTYPQRHRSNSGTADVTPKESNSNLRGAAGTATPESSAKLAATAPQQHQPQTLRLFGTYMNHIATYQDINTVYLTSEGMLSWVTSTVYERFSGGGYMSGAKLVRGYSEAKKGRDEKYSATLTGDKFGREQAEAEQKSWKRRSAPPGPQLRDTQDREEDHEEGKSPVEQRRDSLQRQISSLMESTENPDPEKEEEQVWRREEKEIRDDYNASAGDVQGREIEHLVLVTHGIGQLLGLRMESVNFIHDVNVMRKTLKSVYSTSADLKALNLETGEGPGNCRVQVLPVCWRHLLDFPRKRQEKRDEHDIGVAQEDEIEYPSLEDITIEGVAFARSLISDLALDVLLYQSAYREQITQIVLKESNRIYQLFRERNPGFHGKVHIMGHSLGSAIMFDILCRQKGRPESEALQNPLRFWPAEEKATDGRDPRELSFDFDVDDFYCLGSPVGLFQMLKGRTVSARHLPDAMPSESPFNPEGMDDPFLQASATSSSQPLSPITGLPFSVSSPKVEQLFNIFHPSDPISYRMEPLISPAMSSLKPQALPYTKKGIFGNVAPQGLTGIGAKVGQSVSGLWSSFSAGVASNLLNRSLGLSHEDVANMTANQQHQTPSPGAGTNIAAGVITDAAGLGEKTNARKRQLADPAHMAGRSSTSGNEITLIDDELETLYSRFQQGRATSEKGYEKIRLNVEQEDEKKVQKLRKEEMKIRALNRNGRVDYSIQESVLDFNPITTIASHMAYWADEDVSHFIMSQLLSNRSSRTKPR